MDQLMDKTMLFKTLVAFVITASFAGSAVYFGVQPQRGGNTVGETSSITIKPPSKIDSFLKKTTKKPAQVKTVQYRVVEVALKPEPQPPESQPNVKDLRKAQKITLEKAPQSLIAGQVYVNKKNILKTLLAQAEQIDTVELKDQAYLDIVNYAAKHELYGQADMAMKKIDQVELRDTARGQIAISMARIGRAAEAFSIIDTVEIDSLRDVLRLQVIEAIVLPNRPPLTIQ